MLSNWRNPPRPVAKSAEQGNRITGDTGKSVDDERDSAGSVVARKRSNVRGARPTNCCNAFFRSRPCDPLGGGCRGEGLSRLGYPRRAAAGGFDQSFSFQSLIRARPLPSGNPADVSNSGRPHCSRPRRCRSVVRTRSAGYCPIVPFASMCISFQHRPMRPVWRRPPQPPPTGTRGCNLAKGVCSLLP
jgi:hypothetical protein